MRIIFDANVLISALLFPKSLPRLIYSRATQETLIASQQTLDEIQQLVYRPKFDRYISLEDRIAFVATYRQQCELVSVQSQIDACRDPKDNKYLELAVSGKARCIVTGDKDLLALHPFQGIAILSPKDFLDWLNAQEQVAK